MQLHHPVHRDAGKPFPRGLDCGTDARHQDIGPQRGQLMDLLDDDLARLAAAGGVFIRPLHRVEAAHLEGAGYRVPHCDRRRWSVRVHPWGPGAVCRVIRDGTGHDIAELIDQPASVE